MTAASLIRMFQFYDSPIKRKLRVYVYSHDNCFNSMIVRLKAIVPMIRDFPLPSFNSMIVRLKVCIRGSVGRQSEGVSIL